ncbi:MAG: hypothetical protein ACR2NA_02300 [Solirubrobacterales bacterium]
MASGTLDFEQMAKNGSRGTRRVGAVEGRSQSKDPRTGRWTQRDTTTGRFKETKKAGGSFKGVRRER